MHVPSVPVHSTAAVAGAIRATAVGPAQAIESPEVVSVAVCIAACAECRGWQEVLHRAGWRSFCKKGHQLACPRIDWLMKHEGQVFAFYQLERAAVPQNIQLPASQAALILQLFETAGLVQH